MPELITVPSLKSTSLINEYVDPARTAKENVLTPSKIGALTPCTAPNMTDPTDIQFSEFEIDVKTCPVVGVPCIVEPFMPTTVRSHKSSGSFCFVSLLIFFYLFP